ncbi:type II toxin-antitoxin system HipA family toxin [Promicromonospora sp. NPDC023987]|uniref:type II toxin-antitoxin system HipA family toxin n=1 Tax=Promicromonospora sp. NPDC023987 TaxID=3155360 RepID=UPI0033CC7B14
MTDRLTVWLDGTYIGNLDQADDGILTFRYSDTYRSSTRASALSVSMPLVREHHADAVVRLWVDNLLPDNDDVRARWARELDERRVTAFNLLKHMGADCAGAVQFLHDDETFDSAGEFVPLADDAIAAHLRTLRHDDSAWDFEESGGRWSLGGQQGKFALARSADGAWGLPTGRAPSTHIFKVGVARLADSDAAEYVTMRAARKLGLQVAEIELCRFGQELAVVVERFDRSGESGPGYASGLAPRRVHQEDMCQALGLPRTLKYQADGGPSVGDISALLGRVIPPRRLERARHGFAEATVFNWLTAGTDAHAKNYALIHVGGSSALAPLYDLMSAALVMDEQEVFYRGKLAMKLGGQYGIRQVGWRQVEKAARDLAVDADWLIHRATEMWESIPAAFADAVDEAGSAIDPSVGRQFKDGIAALVGRLKPV